VIGRAPDRDADRLRRFETAEATKYAADSFPAIKITFLDQSA